MSARYLDRRAALRLGVMALAAVPLATRWTSAVAGDSSEAAGSVQQLNQALIAIMKAGQRVPFAQRFAMIAPVVDRTFDLDQILRVSVGARWATLTPDEQAALQKAFRQYTVANFVANFDSYDGQAIDVVPGGHMLTNGDVVVATQIGAPGGSPATLAYVMRPGGAGWRAVDVLADGSISRVATQRSDFRGLLASGGGPALVASLQSKVATLSGGSLA